MNEKSGKKSAGASISSEKLFSLISFATAVLAMILFALAKTILYFNLTNANTVTTVSGVFSIFVFALSIAGMVLSYFVKNGKPSLELFLNAGVLVVAALTLAR